MNNVIDFNEVLIKKIIEKDNQKREQEIIRNMKEKVKAESKLYKSIVFE